MWQRCLLECGEIEAIVQTDADDVDAKGSIERRRVRSGRESARSNAGQAATPRRPHGERSET
jgi:hypothetical protein